MFRERKWDSPNNEWFVIYEILNDDFWGFVSRFPRINSPMEGNMWMFDFSASCHSTVMIRRCGDVKFGYPRNSRRLSRRHVLWLMVAPWTLLRFWRENFTSEGAFTTLLESHWRSHGAPCFGGIVVQPHRIVETEKLCFAGGLCSLTGNSHNGFIASPSSSSSSDPVVNDSGKE